MALQLVQRAGYWYVMGTEFGQRIRKSTDVPIEEKGSQKKAEKALREISKSLEKSLAEKPESGMTVRELVDHYVQGKASNHADTITRIFSFFGDDAKIDKAIDRIDDYRVYLHKRGHKPATIANYLTHVVTVFGYARKRGWTTKTFEVDKPKIRMQVKSLREEEVDALVEHSPDWLKPHLIFLRNTGLRVSELMALTREDIDLENRRAIIRDTKNGEDRIIPLNDAAMRVLADLPNEGTLFRNSDGKPFAYVKGEPANFLNRPIIAAAKRAGIRHVTPHMLRHTFATRLVEAGANIVVVQALGGWKSLNMAARYGKADLRAQDQYANLISKDYTHD